MKNYYYSKTGVQVQRITVKTPSVVIQASRQFANCMLTLSLVSIALAANAQFANVPLTPGSFNVDFVADGAVGAGTNSTNAAVDGTAAASFVFASTTFNPGSGICAAGATALPASNQITSTNATTATGITYTLQSYGSGTTLNNNALQLTSTLTSGTLTPVTPFSASKLYFVCLGGSGATVFNVTLNFSDATTQTITGLSADDWCSATVTNRLTSQQYYRIARNATTCTGGTCQYLFEIAGSVSAANYGKTINSMTVNWVSGGFLGIMAVGMQSVCTVPNLSPSFSTPLAATSTSQITGAINAASPVPSGGYLVVRYPAGSAVTTPVTGTSYPAGASLGLGTSVQAGASTTITANGLTGGTAYDFYVYSYNQATNCGGPVYSSTALSQLSVSTQACGGPVTPTTIAIGPGLPNDITGGFTSIANALGNGFATSLGTTGISAPVTLELQSTYTSEVSTTSLVISFNGCFTPTNNLTIRPAAGANGLNITSSVAGPTVDLDGAKYVTFDGTPGGTVGTPAMAPIAAGTNNAINLNIKNTSTTGVAMRFKNDASNNTVKYCDLQGANTGAPLAATGTAQLADRGVVFIGTTTGVGGNDNVIIDHCNIHPAVANATMTMGVYSYSTQASAPVPAFNDACQITNNNIYDIYGGTALGSTGIGLAGGTDSWTISGNSFFQTASRTPVLTASIVNRAIFVAPTNPGTGQGNNFTVTGNFVGGTAPSCGGTAMTSNTTGSFNNQLTAIEISVAGGTASNVKSNTITNINISQAASTGDIMRAIAVTNNGNVNVGGTLPADGNVVGSSTATNVIALSSTSAAPSHMILVSGGATSATNIVVRNNKIGGVRTAGTGTSLTGVFCNSTATITIDNNLIGSTTVANSFEAAGNTTTAQMVNGIRIPSGSCTPTITNNTICNLNNNSLSTTSVTGNSTTVPPQTGGIIITGSTTTVLVQSISNNIIRNLSNSAPTPSNLQSAALVGIGTNSTAATAMTISNNIIDSLYSSAATGNVLIEGISYFGSTSNNNIISGNFIHSIGVNPSSTTASIRGIECATGAVSVVNNMIRLGVLANGNSLTNPITIYGMLNSATTQNFYYNTVYIGGSGVIAGANNTFAYWRNSTLAANAKNNIFYNARSGAGAGRHYSIYFSSATAFTNVLSLNNNVYYAPGTNGTFAFNGTANVTSYSPGWFTGDLNSVYGNPVLLNPDGSATGTPVAALDLHCNTSVGSAAESGGVVISGINNDRDGDIRQGSGGYSGTGTAPDIGADEFEGIMALPIINSVSISPNTTQCIAAPHNVTATVTASGPSAPITSVTINYTVNSVAQTGIVMTLTSGSANGTSVWDGTIPVPTPANATIVWTITASDGIFSKTSTSSTYADAPQTLVTPVVTASVNPVCSGSATSLTVTPTYTAYSWTDGITTVGTTNPVTVNPSSTTTYTVTGTHSSGCTITATILVSVNPLPSAPTATPSTQCGIGIPAASVTSTSGLGGPQFYWYSVPSGGSVLQYPPLGGSLATYYSNNFTSATLSNSSISGAAAISGGVLALQPTTTSTGGALTVNASGFNSNLFQTDFDLSLIATGTQIADGFSYCIGDDAIPLNNGTTPTAEHGSGSKIRICFMTYNTAGGSDGKGIYLLYGSSATTGFTAATTVNGTSYSSNVSWIPTSAGTINSHITMSINSSGQLTLMLGATTIFNNVQLPAGYLSADRSTWKHIFSSRSGGVVGGFTMDNLVIQANSFGTGYTTYQSPISTTTTFYVSEKDPSTGCESSPRTPVIATVTYGDTVVGAAKIGGSPITALCLGNTFELSTTQAASNNNYTYTWTASSTNSGITGSVSGGTSGSPTPVNVTPVASGVYTFTLTYTDGTCTGSATVIVTANPLPTITSASASPNPICNGSSTTLTGLTQTGGPLSGQIGTATTTTTGQPSPYYTTWWGNKNQYLIRASELTAAGFSAGNITSLGFWLGSVSTTLNLTNFTISMGHTALTVMPGTFQSGLTTVYTNPSYSVIANANTVTNHTFSTPFAWDGVSNIVVETCFNNNNWNGSQTIRYTTTAFVSSIYYNADAATVCSAPGTPTTSSNRPNLYINGTNIVSGPGSYNWQWNPGAINSNVALVSPTATSIYTVTATIPASGCTSTATASVTVIPVPSAPTGASSVQCGYGVPTASVTSTSGEATPVFKWYSAASGGTLLQSGTSNTYTTAINSTQTFYVTELVGICESSPRTMVTATVNPADTVSIVTNDKTCVGTANPFSVSQVGTNQTYTSYSWSATPAAGSGVVGTPTGATQTFAPTATGTYSYVVIASDGVCTSIDTQVVVAYVGLTGSVTATQILSCVYPTGLITTNVSGAGTVVNNDFSSSTLPSYMTIQGSASITGGELVVTPTAASQSGSVLVQNTTGLANNDFQIDFDFITKGPAGVPFGPTAADGLSYSYGDDVVAGTYQGVTNASTNIGYPSGSPVGNVAEGGSGTKLKISFDPWNNGTGTLSGINGGTNYAGIYFMYNCTDYFNAVQSPTGATANDNARGVLAFSPATWWRATSTQTALPVNTTHVTIVMAGAEPGYPNGSTTLTLTGTTGLAQGNVFGPVKVALPPGYLAADKSTWKHVFAARTGGNWEGHSIDNLSIRYNNFYEYSIDSGASWSQTTPIVPPGPGTYPVLARYVSVPGCFANIGTAVIDAPSFTSTTTQANICAYSATQPTLSFTPVFGSGATYQWESSPAGMNTWSPVSGANSVTYTPAPGTVTVNTDFRCVIMCSGTPIPGSPTSIITITPETPLVTDTTPATRCGIGTVDLQANVTAGATAMWYTAASGGTSIGSGSPFTTPIISGTTTFYVSAATGSGCESGRSAVVATVTPAPSVTVSSPVTICEGDNTTLSASSSNDPNYIYTWNPGGFVGSSVIVTPSATTTYTLTALDNSGGANNNCQDIKTVTITVNQRPTINSLASSPGALCMGDSAQISLLTTPFVPPSGNYTVTSIPFSPVSGTMPNAGPPSGDEGNMDAPLGFNFNYFGNTYTGVTIHANGQILMGTGNASANSVYSPPAIPSVNAPNNWVGFWSDLNLSGSDVTWGIVGSAPYRKLVVNFTNVNYFSATPFVTFQTVLNETYNTIEVHMTSTNGSVGNTRAIGVENSTGTLGTAAPARNSGTWAATNESWLFAPPVASSLTYSWSPATGLSSTSAQNPKAAPATNTTYTVTVSETGTGCTQTATLDVVVSARPKSFLQEGDTVLCSNNPGYYLHVLDSDAYVGGYPAGTQFDFYGAGNLLYQTGTDNFFFVSSSDIYKAVITLPSSLGGCTDTTGESSIDFGTSQAPQYVLSTDSVNCYGTSTGKAVVEIVFGGTPDFRYQWYDSGMNNLLRDVTGSALSDTLQNVPAGMYVVVITDHQGYTTTPYCSVIDSIYIDEPSAPLGVSENTGAHVDVLCYGDVTGSLDIDVAGGTPDYTYTWSNGATTEDISGLIAGTYTVTVMDSKGCTASLSLIITQPAPIPLAISGNTSICDGYSTVLDAGAGYTDYQWSTGVTTQSITVSTAGTYTVTVTNETGCTASASVSVVVNANPTPSITGASLACASSTLNAGSGYVNYSWSNGATTQVINVTATGTYTVTVTNASGCTGTASQAVTIVTAAPAKPGVISGPAAVCKNSNVTFTIAAVPGASSYTWTASSGATVSTGQGSTSVVINFSNAATSASLSVVANNICGSSAARTLAYTVSSVVPATPATINGQLYGLCNQTGVAYNCPAVSNATSYLWTVPAGVTILSGQGTNSITVKYTNAFTNTGILSVVAQSGCGNSPAISRTVNAKPAQTVISGNNWACKGQQGVPYSVSPVYGATSYTWTVVAGSTLVSGQGTTSIVVNWGAINGVITCKANNGCGSGVAGQKPVSFTCREEGDFFDMSTISLFPNPASTSVNVQFDAFAEGKGHLIVFDLIGQQMLNEDLSILNGNNQYAVDISNYPKGSYIVKVIFNGKERNMKLLVQ